MTISKYNLMIAMLAITFGSSACAPTIKVSNYCDLRSNYAGTKVYHDHPLVLAQVFGKDYDLFIDRVHLFSIQRASVMGDHAIIVGDEERTVMMVIILDKNECITNKISLSPAFYKAITGIGDELVSFARSIAV